MTAETWIRLQHMDIGAIEIQLALQCAPVILGLKPSNLLQLPKKESGRAGELLKLTEIKSLSLYEGKPEASKNEKAVFFLYRKKPLLSYLKNPAVVQLLAGLGYADFSFHGLLSALSTRYGAYREKGAGFPHEIGVFLGYPVSDVRGFVENEGKNCLYAGYWKVYEDAERKRKLFWYYERAAELLIQLLAQGASIEDVLACA